MPSSISNVTRNIVLNFRPGFGMYGTFYTHAATVSILLSKLLNYSAMFYFKVKCSNNICKNSALTLSFGKI